MRKSLIGWIIASIITVSLTGCSLLPKEEEALRPPLVKPAQENYRTVQAELGTITQEIKGNGTMESYYSEAVQFTTGGGRIKEVLVKAGDNVKKGDVLIRLNMDNLDIELKQHELNLARSRQSLGQAKLGDDPEQLNIAQIQFDIDSMKYERLRTALDSKQLVANIDGQVTFVDSLEEGDMVEVYRTIVMISDPTKLRFAFQPGSSPEVSSIGVGFTANLTFAGDIVLEGNVTQTPSSAPLTDDKILKDRYTSTIYIELNKLPEGASIGTRADVSIILQVRENVIKIPRSGLRSFLGRTFVRILEDGDKIREIDVEAGLKSSTEIEITKGLEEGALVVLP